MFDARKLLDALVSAGSQGGGQKQLGGMLGQVTSMAGQVLNQATGGVRQGATEINQQTGATQKASDFLRRTTGQNPADLVARAKDLAAKYPVATGVAIGGLAAVLLGTGAGRKIAGSAARMGGMALVGGLAYKALQNYQAGKPLLDLQNVAQDLQQPRALPPPSTDNEQALRLVRAMVAAASSDGIVDETERHAIVGNLKAAGIEAEAAQFLESEFANPADPVTLAQGITNPEEAAQVYAAARLAIDPDTADEQAFLKALAGELQLDPSLVAHIDAAASNVKA
ncbi:tellurite resistance TerB family protein [Rhabdaerophilum sp.]|uniref:tellurite resistance TerB family protein n=1 Tax=Rhabdaerophilum sp. TaxID=2717341 RepID=UPI0038D467E2